MNYLALRVCCQIARHPQNKMCYAAKLALCGRRGQHRLQREGPWSASPVSWCGLGDTVDIKMLPFRQ